MSIIITTDAVYMIDYTIKCITNAIKILIKARYMASEVVDIRERIERVRAEMAGEVVSDNSNEILEKSNFSEENIKQHTRKETNLAGKSELPDFKLTVQNPVSPKVLLFLILMQLITSIVLVAVIYFK